MDLFEITGSHVYPSTHALLLKPYKDIWENDTSPNKEDSIKWFTYIEFLCSPKKSNPFYGYIDKEMRAKKVKIEVFGDEDYMIPMDLMMATIAYEEHLKTSSPAYEILIAGETVANKLNTFLKELNPSQKTTTGGLLLKPKEIYTALAEIPKAIKAMAEARDKVNEELKEDSKTRNNRQIGYFER